MIARFAACWLCCHLLALHSYEVCSLNTLQIDMCDVYINAAGTCMSSLACIIALIWSQLESLNVHIKHLVCGLTSASPSRKQIFHACHICLAVHVIIAICSQHALCICREGSFTEEDAIAVGVAAGKELKEQAGDDFFDWARQNVY